MDRRWQAAQLEEHARPPFVIDGRVQSRHARCDRRV
jgi:hypothetical protein